MQLHKFLSGAVLLGALTLSAGANAAILVQINPNNEGLTGLGGPSYGPFTASGALGGLASTLTIAGYGSAVPQSYSETGRIVINQWTGGTSGGLFQQPSLSNFTYGIFADFSLSGLGLWSVPGSLSDCATLYPDCATFTAGSAAFSGTVYGSNQGTAVGTQSVTLGTLSLNPAYVVGAKATIDLITGNANTALTAVFNFTPDAGAVGAGNFFLDYPGIPMSFIFSSSNIGGNFLNTSASPNPPATGNTITISTPGSQANLGAYPGSFNVTFDANVVPEPGSLALVGLGLAALGGMRRRSRLTEV